MKWTWFDSIAAAWLQFRTAQLEFADAVLDPNPQARDIGPIW